MDFFVLFHPPIFRDLKTLSCIKVFKKILLNVSGTYLTAFYTNIKDDF